MKKLKPLLILVLLFVAATIISFYFEGAYRKEVRYLYGLLTNNKITFEHPLKYIHFPSDLFIFSFGFYLALVVYLLRKQSARQLIINIFITLLTFLIALLVCCYVDSSIKLLECTACDDGTRILKYNDIRYDTLFVTSLAISIFPILIIELRKFLRKRVN